MSKNLPKWPQCLIYGDQVTVEQALEMIALTDSFFHGATGNDKIHIRKVYADCGFPVTVNDTYLCHPEMDYDKLNEVNESRGALGLDYLSTSWISSSYIGGPNGWIHPNGVIAHSKNIGKWPSVEEVTYELAKIASSFPFLKMTVVLMDGEQFSDEPKSPVVAFYVADGKVTLNESPTQADMDYVGQAKQFGSDIFEFSFKPECGLTQLELNAIIASVQPHVQKVYGS